MAFIDTSQRLTQLLILKCWNSWSWWTPHVPINVFSIKCIHPPIGNVIPVKTALVEEDCVKVFVFLQAAICRGKASRLRTASRVERFSAQAPTPHSAQVVLLASVGLVPKENVPKEYTWNEISSWCFVWVFPAHFRSSLVALRCRSFWTCKPKFGPKLFNSIPSWRTFSSRLSWMGPGPGKS